MDRCVGRRDHAIAQRLQHVDREPPDVLVVLDDHDRLAGIRARQRTLDAPDAPETVRSWRHNGRGPKHFKLGKRVLYAAEDVESWIESARHGSPDAA